ncbi:uncharacterized protein RJT20DRAFT_147673 [Scheffersomyces xylosifermentans]|uniref:uncharacterized protein n=1 Tax=Scheffersomyces xylosifermentans TaxID=1304137 RepID=UPI00315DD829
MTQLTAQEVDKKYNESIDLSLFKEGPEHFESSKKLADTLEKSLSTYGFFSLINHGIDTQTFEELKAIAQSILELPVEEQGKYLAGTWKSDLEDRTKSLGAERGQGYKPKGYWSMRNGVEDSIIHYNFNKMLHPSFFDETINKYPEPARVHLKEIADYFRYLHNVVLRKITILCDIILEIPEGFLWDNYFSMLYHNMKPEDEAKVGKNWLRGHSDSGGFTFITSQPILSLQIRDYYTGEWKYVGHTPNALIVNIAYAMEFIIGGYFKSSIHRVVSPPDDQKNYRRLVLIYFSGPKSTSIVDPEPLNSPKLKRLGFEKPAEWEKITFSHWNNEKGRIFGKKAVNDSAGVEPNLRWHQAESNFTIDKARKRFKVIEI